MNTGLKLVIGSQALALVYALAKGRVVPAIVAGAGLAGIYYLCRDEKKSNTTLKVMP